MSSEQKARRGVRLTLDCGISFALRNGTPCVRVFSGSLRRVSRLSAHGTQTLKVQIVRPSVVRLPSPSPVSPAMSSGKDKRAGPRRSYVTTWGIFMGSSSSSVAKIMRPSSWKEGERDEKGRARTRWRDVISMDEEIAILVRELVEASPSLSISLLSSITVAEYPRQVTRPSSSYWPSVPTSAHE